ncbi:MAG: AMP-dependent synthetase, partial [Deltaproteobacteria bacterium]
MDPLQRYLSKPWVKFYQPGVPPSVEFQARPVFQLFDEAAARWPGRDALVFYGRGITYRELSDAIDRLSCALAELGVRKGDRVAIYLVNSPQFVIAYFAALKCGAAVTSISPLYTSHEVRYQLEDSGARVVVCQDLLYEKVAKCGAPLDAVVVTSVGEFLPPLKRLLGKTALARLFPEMNLGAPRIPPAANLHWLQDLLKKYPPRPPQVT